MPETWESNKYDTIVISSQKAAKWNLEIKDEVYKIYCKVKGTNLQE